MYIFIHLFAYLFIFKKNRFVSVSPLEEPIENGSNDQVFISKSYDATSHFETVCEDVHDLWKRITGEPLVLKKKEGQETA